MDKLEALSTFVKVVESASISKAADRLDLAKSAVSRRLADLEQHLDVQLFRRTTRRIDLTDTGRSLYERALRLLADWEEMEMSISAEHTGLSGNLRVAVPHTFGMKHLIAAVNDFLEEHPKVTFDLDFNDRQVDILQESFDIAVRIARLDDSSLIARRLAPVRSVVIASPAYLARYGTPSSPQALADHQCLVYTNLPDPGVWPFKTTDAEEIQVKVHATMKANSGEYLCKAAIAGHGITRQPTFICYEAIEKGELIPILTNYAWYPVYAYAVYPQTRHLSRRVRAFVDFLAERFKGIPYWDKCMQDLLPSMD